MFTKMILTLMKRKSTKSQSVKQRRQTGMLFFVNGEDVWH